MNDIQETTIRTIIKIIEIHSGQNELFEVFDLADNTVMVNLLNNVETTFFISPEGIIQLLRLPNDDY